MTDSISRSAAAVLRNHRVYRNGSFWACYFCRSAWPFGIPLPRSAGPCVPRRWGDQ
jgi:hypothetical protein